MNKRGTLILGGARSGKSRFAQEMAGNVGRKVLFVATAEALDVDMQARIEKHQQDRPGSWHTLEASTNVADGIRQHICDADVVLIDDVTLLVSNIFLGGDRGFSGTPEVGDPEERIVAEINALIELMQQTGAIFIIVSNEVGLGVVPENRLARLYRDLLGRANQMLAQAVDEVYFMVAGIPMKVKG